MPISTGSCLSASPRNVQTRKPPDPIGCGTRTPVFWLYWSMMPPEISSKALRHILSAKCSLFYLHSMICNLFDLLAFAQLCHGVALHELFVPNLDIEHAIYVRSTVRLQPLPALYETSAYFARTGINILLCRSCLPQVHWMLAELM